MARQVVIDAEAGVVFNRRGLPFRATSGQGYVQVTDNAKYLCPAHRLIWESVHGPIPSGMQINHINGVKADNRIANLELVTPAENVHHALTTGLHGRRISGATRKGGKWQAQIRTNGRTQYLGLFATREEAEAAYANASALLRGRFA